MSLTPEQVAAAQLEAYNAKDLERFAALHDPEVEGYDLAGERLFAGRQALRERYARRFETPGPKALVPHRVVLGARVVDHELVWLDGEDAPPTELVVVYTVRDGMIRRVDFVRAA